MAAVVGASLLALGAVTIYFAPGALGETVSMLPVAAGFALALPRGDRNWRLLGVALLAIAVFLRLQNVLIFAAGGPGPAYYNYVVVDKDHLAANPPPAEAHLVKRDHDWSLSAQVPPAG